MANNKKYLGGSNQIAHLPYKTIDALQQLGINIEKGSGDQYFINTDSTEHIVNNLPGDLPIIITSRGEFKLNSEDIANIGMLYKGGRNMFIWKDYNGLDFCICGNLFWNDSTHTDLNFDALEFRFNQDSKKMFIYYWHFDSSNAKSGDLIYTVPEQKYRHNIKVTSGNDIFFLVREMPTDQPITRGFGLENGWNMIATTTQCSGYNTTAGKTIVAFNYLTFGHFSLTYSDGTESQPIAMSGLTSDNIVDVVSEY